MAQKIAVVIDPWDFPFNGTVVSTRRFLHVLQEKFDFHLFVTSVTNKSPGFRYVEFAKLSIPGFNGIINRMKVPLAYPHRKTLEARLADCDLLHMQFPFFLGFAAVAAARRLKLPIICSFHVQPENILRNIGLESRLLTNLLYRFFIRALYNHANLVIAPSEFAASLLRMHGLTAPVTVLSNGVPEHFFDLPLKPQGTGPFTLLSVGRLAREKQHDVLLAALALSEFSREIELYIVGTGPMEDRLVRQASRLGLKVKIASVSDEALLQLYEVADLFIHAGEIELEGMSVLEAMASGKVVLISDSSGSAASELITDEAARFNNRNELDLASRIDFWLRDASLREVTGANNRNMAATRSHKKSSEQLAMIYQSFYE